MKSRSPEPARVGCPKCQSRLDVLETRSGGGLTVSVFALGALVERNAVALELFMPPGTGNLRCPACSMTFDPSGPRPIPPLRRS